MPEEARIERAPRGEGFWRNTMLELALLYGCVVLAELLVMDGRIGLHDFHPNPYWVVVLPMAAARGVVAAMLAAGIAGTLCTAGLLHATGGSLLDIVRLEHMREPVLFFAMGFLIGELRDTLAGKHRRLWRRYERVQEHCAEREREVVRLHRENHALERRVFDQNADFDNLISVVASVESVAITGLYDLPLTMVEDYCGATKCSVLLVLGDGSVDVAARRGWDDDEVAELILQASEAEQVKQAIARGLPADGFHPAVPGTHTGPLLVAPIPDRSGVVHALLCLDDIPAERMDEQTRPRFLAIAEWIAARLRQIPGAAESDEAYFAIHRALHSAKWISSPEELSKRLFLEDLRSSRQGIGSGILAIQFTGFSARVPGSTDRVDRWLADHVCPSLRDSDELFRFGYPGCYVIVLTGVDSEEETLAIPYRITSEASAAASTGVGRIDVTSFDLDEKAPTFAALLPRLTASFHARSDVPLDPRCPVPFPAVARPGDAVGFARRLRLEAAIAERHGLDLHLIHFSGSKGEVDLGRMIARHLEQATAAMMRGSDGIFVLAPNRCVVIMPGTDSLSAVSFWQRFRESLVRTIPERRLRNLSTEFLAVEACDLDALVGHLLGRPRKSPDAHTPGERPEGSSPNAVRSWIHSGGVA